MHLLGDVERIYLIYYRRIQQLLSIIFIVGLSVTCYVSGACRSFSSPITRLPFPCNFFILFSFILKSWSGSSML